MSNVLILTENWASLSNAFSYSSQASGFPASNALNANRRSKVWRTAGYWTVESGSNTIIFRESVGINLTATVAAGNYTSTTSLCAALKTALEATGASTYTVSQDATTGKLKIVSDGLGGGGIFQLMWTHASSADMADLLGFDTSVDQTGSLTYLADLLVLSSGEWLKWDLGVSSNPKAFVLLGNRNSPLQISPDATITLQGNETDVWSSPSYSQVLTYSDLNLSLFNEDGLHTEALRYWRVLIEDPANPNLYSELSYAYLGEAFVPTRGAVQFPLNQKYIDRSTTVFSEAGYESSDIREQAGSFDLDWFGLTVSEKEEIDSIFAEFGTSKPFIIALDPNAVFSSDSSQQVLLVKFEESPRWQLVSPGNFAASMSIREVL